jgi:hypothetical protein
MIYEGSCHCGNIAFEVEGEFKQGVDCNARSAAGVAACLLS